MSEATVVKEARTMPQEEAAREVLRALEGVIGEAIAGYRAMLGEDTQARREMDGESFSSEEAGQILERLEQMVACPGEKQWGSSKQRGARRGKVIFGPPLRDDREVDQLIVSAEGYSPRDGIATASSFKGRSAERVYLETSAGEERGAYSLTVTLQRAKREGGKIEGGSLGVRFVFNEAGDLLRARGIVFVANTPHLSERPLSLESSESHWPQIPGLLESIVK